MAEDRQQYTVVPLDTSMLSDLLPFWSSIPGVGINEIDDTPEALTRFLERNPGLSCAVRVDDRLVGTLLCGHDGRRAMLYHVCVLPAFRNCGMGTAMVNRTLRLLRNLGITKCQLVCFRDNDFGNGFWSSHDWVLRSDLLVWQQPLAGSSAATDTAAEEGSGVLA